MHDPVGVQSLPLAVSELEDKGSLVPDQLQGFVKDELVPTIAMPEALPCVAVGPAPTAICTCFVPGGEVVHLLPYSAHEIPC